LKGNDGGIIQKYYRRIVINEPSLFFTFGGQDGLLALYTESTRAYRIAAQGQTVCVAIITTGLLIGAVALMLMQNISKIL